MLITDPDRMVRQALAYARRGWLVFPCRPGGKQPATRHGFRDASGDRTQIESWWEERPAANLGVVTGAPGPDVLDVDQHGAAGNGFGALRRLQVAGLADSAGSVVATPGGGLHLYFDGSEQACGRLSRCHLDFRSKGGYVLAPPSIIGDRRYRVISQSARAGRLSWAAVTELLEPGASRPIRPRLGATADGVALVAWVERLQTGNRNSGLFWAACRAAEAGQLGLLEELGAAAAKTGLPDREIARTIASALRTVERRRIAA